MLIGQGEVVFLADIWSPERYESKMSPLLPNARYLIVYIAMRLRAIGVHPEVGPELARFLIRMPELHALPLRTIGPEEVMRFYRPAYSGGTLDEGKWFKCVYDLFLKHGYAIQLLEWIEAFEAHIRSRFRIEREIARDPIAAKRRGFRGWHKASKRVLRGRHAVAKPPMTVKQFLAIVRLFLVTYAITAKLFEREEVVALRLSLPVAS